MDIRFQFQLKDKTSKKPTSIRLVFYKDGKRFVYGTGKLILSGLWDYNNQRPIKSKSLIKTYEKEYPQISHELDNISHRCQNIKAECKRWFALKERENQIVNLNDLKAHLNNRFKINKKDERVTREYDLYTDNALREFLKGITSGKIQTNNRMRYKLASIKVYRSLLRVFKQFQDVNHTRYRLTDIDRVLAQQFVDFLYSKRKVSKSTVGKYNKHFKKAIKEKLSRIEILNYDLEKEGKPKLLSDRDFFKIKAGLAEFKYLKSSATKISLNEEELDELFHLNKLSKRQRELCDIFLCGCYTALRYSDYSRLNGQHINKTKHPQRVEIFTIKTGNKVSIPIRKELWEILEKYNFSLPNSTTRTQ